MFQTLISITPSIKLPVTTNDSKIDCLDPQEIITYIVCNDIYQAKEYLDNLKDTGFIDKYQDISKVTEVEDIDIVYEGLIANLYLCSTKDKTKLVFSKSLMDFNRDNLILSGDYASEIHLWTENCIVVKL